MARFAVLVCLLSALLAFSSFAQTPATADPQALSLAAQSLKAMGVTGPIAIPMKATGQILTPALAKDGDFEVVALGPRAFRTIVVRDTGSYTYLVNNNQGYVTYQGKKRFLSQRHTFGERCEYFPFYSFLGELTALDLTLMAPVKNALDGKPTYILRASYADPTNLELTGSVVTELEIDAQTFLPMRFRLRFPNDFNTDIVTGIEYAYGDYRQEGPFLLPHAIQMSADGTPQLFVTIQSVELNTAVNLADFTVR